MKGSAGTSNHEPHEAEQEEPPSSAAQQGSSPESSERGSHAGLLVRAPTGTCEQSAGTSDASEQTSSLQQSPAERVAAVVPEQHTFRAVLEHSQSLEPEQAEPSASSSDWSSQEQDGDEAEVLGQMAQSMLAALSPSQHGMPHGTSSVGLHGQKRHQVGKQNRQAAAASASVAPVGVRQVAIYSRVPDIRWDPAVQLPALQTADGGMKEDILSKVKPVPEGQV